MGNLSVKGFLLMFFVLGGILGFSNFWISYNSPPATENSSHEFSAVKSILKKIDVDRSDWKTITMSSSRKVKIPKKKVWEVWSKIENWKYWPNASVKSTRWLSKPEWRIGSEFEQEVGLGFPLGTEVLKESIFEYKEGESVGWYRNAYDYISYNLWKFEELPDGNTIITSAQVLNGYSVGMLKPLVAERWQTKLDESVEGFVKYLLSVN